MRVWLTLVLLSLYSLNCFSNNIDSASSDFYSDLTEISATYKTTPLSQYKLVETMMSDQDVPYLSVQWFFGTVLGYAVSCDHSTQKCIIESRPPGTTITLNFHKKTVHIKSPEKNETFNLSTEDFHYGDGKYWLKYNLFDRLIDVELTWYAQFYSFNMVIDTTIVSLDRKLRQERLDTIFANQNKPKEDISSIFEKALKPTRSFNIEGLLNNALSISGSDSTKPQESFSNTYNVNSDIFGGNFTSNGTILNANQLNPSYSWQYALRNTPYFSNLTMGSVVNSQSNSILGGASLQNGFVFDSKEPAGAQLQFEYNGSAIPGTDVEVWRGGYLVKALTVPSSGQFTVVDNQASPGDRYKIQYYFPNGTQETKEVTYTGNFSAIIKKGEWDFSSAYGQLSSGTNNLGSYNFNLLRYGLFSDFTLGVGNYYLPLDQTGSQHKLLWFVNGGWQPVSFLNLSIDKFINNPGYLIQGQSNLIPRNLINFTYSYLGSNNDIASSPNVTGPISNVRFWQISDNWNIARFASLTSMYSNAIGEDNQKQTLFSNALSLSLPNIWKINHSMIVNWQQDSETGRNYEIIDQLSYLLNNHQFVLGNTWDNQTKQVDSVFSYNYRAFSDKPLNIGVEIEHRNDQFAIGVNANWQYSPNWNFNANLYRDNFGLTVNLGVSYSVAFGLYNDIYEPREFGGGTLQGVLLSPPDENGKQKPQVGVKVQAGSRYAFTEKDGSFTLAGLPTYTPIEFTIVPESLSFEYVPEMETIPVYLRPGSIIEYNPKLARNISIDGVVFSDHAIPSDVEIVAERVDKEGTLRTGKVDYDGYYVIEKVTPGTYKLYLRNSTGALPSKPKEIKIGNNEDWVSDINVEWKQDKKVKSQISTK